MLVRDAMKIPVAGAKWMGVSRGAVFRLMGYHEPL